MAREVEVGNQLYTVAKLFNPKKQAHVLRRAAGVFGGGLTPEGIMKGLSALPDDQFDYVVDTLLSNVKRKDQTTGIWTAVMSSNNDLMFEDIDISIMLVLAYESGVENFGFLSDKNSAIYQFLGKFKSIS